MKIIQINIRKVLTPSNLVLNKLINFQFFIANLSSTFGHDSICHGLQERHVAAAPLKHKHVYTCECRGPNSRHVYLSINLILFCTMCTILGLFCINFLSWICSGLQVEKYKVCGIKA
jgi:hypothetical protein